MKTFTQKEKIELARRYFGFTIKEAKNYTKTASNGIFEEIEKFIHDQAKRAFLED